MPRKTETAAKPGPSRSKISAPKSVRARAPTKVKSTSRPMLALLAVLELRQRLPRRR